MEFHSESELVDVLVREKYRLKKEFDKRFHSSEEIARISVASNTFRAFHHTREKPSVVYREWARERLNAADFLSSLAKLSSEAAYDTWNKSLSRDFTRFWHSQMEQPIPYGAGRKLPDLLMKLTLNWSQMPDSVRSRIIRWVHVPLDRFTLNCLREFAPFRIPKDASMKFVSNEQIYNALQDKCRTIASRADCEPVLLDVFAWDDTHEVTLHGQDGDRSVVAVRLK